MRDPNRINEILDRLKILWTCYPDLRFFQLVECLKDSVINDLFYLEDEQTLKLINLSIKEGFDLDIDLDFLRKL